MTELRANLPRMIVFARVAELGSFSAAARELGLSRPAVSSSIACLEQSLGVTLMHRTTRSLHLTEIGQEFLEHCTQLHTLAMGAVDEAAATSERAVGTLRLASPGGLIAERLIGPVLGELMRDHGVRVDLRSTDRRVGLVEGGFDAAVRVGTPDEDGLVMRRVGRTREVLVAAPALARTIRSPEDLDSAVWISHTSLPRRFVLHGPGRKRLTVTMNPRGLVDDGGAMIGLLRTGAGIGLVPDLALHEDLARKTLVEVLPERRVRRADIFVLMPSRKRVPTRVRLLIEGLERALAT